MSKLFYLAAVLLFAMSNPVNAILISVEGGGNIPAAASGGAGSSDFYQYHGGTFTFNFMLELESLDVLDNAAEFDATGSMTIIEAERNDGVEAGSVTRNISNLMYHYNSFSPEESQLVVRSDDVNVNDLLTAPRGFIESVALTFSLVGEDSPENYRSFLDDPDPSLLQVSALFSFISNSEDAVLDPILGVINLYGTHATSNDFVVNSLVVERPSTSVALSEPPSFWGFFWILLTFMLLAYKTRGSLILPHGSN